MSLNAVAKQKGLIEKHKDNWLLSGEHVAKQEKTLSKTTHNR